jgi:hypothetical protein
MQVMTQQAPVTVKQPSAKVGMGALGDLPFETEMLRDLVKLRTFLTGQPEATKHDLARVTSLEMPMGLVFKLPTLINPVIGAERHNEGLRASLREAIQQFKDQHDSIAPLFDGIYGVIKTNTPESKQQHMRFERTLYQVLGDKVLNLMTGKPFSEPDHDLYTPVVQTAMRERIIRLRDSEPLGLG